jgi:hypothetical protein
MWWRFYNSGWYDACVTLLFATAMGLLFYRFGPQIGPAIDGLVNAIRAQSLEVQVLSVLAIFGLLIWAGVWNINHWFRIER